MSVTSKCKITIAFSGDVAGTQEYDAADNDTSPGVVELHTVSDGGGQVGLVRPENATRMTILKPPDNTVQLYLRGDDTDAGIALHLTDPDSISIGAAPQNLVIMSDPAATDDVTIRVVWS